MKHDHINDDMIIYKSGDTLRCQIDSVSTCAMSEVSRDRLFIVGQVPKAVHHGLQEQRITLLAIAKRTKAYDQLVTCLE